MSGSTRICFPSYGLVALAAAALLGAATAGVVRADDEDCLACHDPEMAEEGYGVDAAAWQSSIHAQLGFGCADCHAGKEDFPHEEAAPALCADCHEEAAEDFKRSVHGENLGRYSDPTESPWPAVNPCTACHGTHDVRAADDPESRVYFRNIPESCGTCHGDLSVVQAQGLSVSQFNRYEESVHGLKRGDPDARPAVCTDCHRAHLVLRANDPDSLINPLRIPATCGQCHAEVSEQYRGSVHGVAYERGVSAAPTCTGCHGIHSIRMVPGEDASPLEKRLVRSTCVACHASEALMSEYGVAAARVRTYQASYHGLAHKRGTKAVADCASCHGIHAIYPSSDPRSSVAPQNLEATCGHCHPGASEVFSRNPVHFAVGGPTIDVVIVNWVKRVYWALILVVLGGMLVHNGIILSHYVRLKIRRERAAESRSRFNRPQLAQHAVLGVSFVLLAVSGFVLAYPDLWWSRILEFLGLTESIRRWVHRVSAVILLSAGVYHVFWILGTRYGRAELRRIFPRGRDVREILDNMRYYLGRRAKPPAAGKYDYPAKIEYWSLVWGTLIMGLTGVILWFPMWATSFLPFWSVKVSEVIHLFEAWLATLAILLFHFFYVFGHPEIYPLNLSMFHGRMAREEAERHHEGWLEDGSGDAVS